MVRPGFYIVHSGRPIQGPLVAVSGQRAHSAIRRERDRPLVAMNRRALQKALMSGFW